ncbi:uncharacterized protein LOC123877124 [Maniola jurtina]|uniref:uncharacterized protein LOC123877124 n=1 Tax=Maniola jurtina TaxID=191418 RepID=UPI001E687A5C|nr:uncharacterized protein LOC123877124 [Maniola jurtina]
MRSLKRSSRRSPVFHCLRVNASLYQHSNPSSLKDLLGKCDSAFGTVTHGLLTQRLRLQKCLKKVAEQHPEATGSLMKILAADTELRTISDDLLQYTCGKRAEIIESRRKLYEPKSSYYRSVLSEIPPSETHLWDEEKLQQAFKTHVNNIKDLTLPGDCKLISLDVDSLFTNVPVNETLNILTKLLENNHINANEITELIELTKICMKQNYFKFNDQFYQQKEGLAMGSPLSPLMADIFMDDFENKHIVKNNNILYYYRYVDDIIICWTGTDEQLDTFVKNLNKIHPKIKFKSELELDNSISFLDLTITRANNKHQFGIFRKPTYTDTTIPASSCHPWQHKLAAFHSYVHRLLSIPLEKENYLKELKIIYHMAQANGYNINIVNNIIKKQQLRRIKKDLYSSPSDKINKYKSSLTYFGTVSERIAKTLKAHDIHVAFRTNNTLKNICNGKDKLNNKQKSGIYKLECSDCKATYVGQTGRKFETRYKEHLAAVRNNQPQKSHFAKHLLDSGHKLSSDHSYKILHTCDKGLRLSMFEQLEIIKHNNNNQFKLLNEQVNVSNSPLLRFFGRGRLEGGGGSTGDVTTFHTLNFSQFDWLEIEDFEMQLIDFQSSLIWIQKFIDMRKELELIETERLTSNISKDANNNILETWNALPETFNCSKKLAHAILTVFSSTYACESLFSEMNNIKDSVRNRLTDESSSACILLKVTSYNPNISQLSSNLQQQKSH